ncbi:MAG TPA: hypothetical protein ENH28_06780 [Euryarchaeota archaeon]|nr:hypothetical protein [Euryarchaeota archaeon]
MPAKAESRFVHKLEKVLINLNRPIILHPGWMEITDTLKKQISIERAEQILKGNFDEATDAEVMVYLSSASMVAPLPYEYANIYLYLFQKTMKRIEIEVPPDLLEVKNLTDYEEQLMKELKGWIWKKSVKGLKPAIKL